MRTQVKVLGTSDPEAVRSVLRTELLRLVDPAMDRSLNLVRPAPAEGYTGEGTPAAAVLMDRLKTGFWSRRRANFQGKSEASEALCRKNFIESV